jgi:hypothetical protein
MNSMKKHLAIEHHVAFQWTVLRSVVAGGLLGLCHTAMAKSSATLSLLSSFDGHWTWLYGAASLALLGTALLPATRFRQAAFLLALTGLAAGVSALRAALGDGWAFPAVGAWSFLLALYAAQGASLSRQQKVATMFLLGLAGVLAQLLPDTLESQGVFLHEPLWLANGVAGGLVGLLLGTATVFRHVVWKDAPALATLQGLLPPADSQDELSKLIRQAIVTFQETEQSLDEHPGARAAAEQLVLKIGRFGKRWQDIETQAQKSDRTALSERRDQLTARIEAATEDGIRSEYRRALVAVEEQLRYLSDIDRGRERAIARLHHQVATLERLRLAALRHRSVGAAKLGEELRPVIEELNQAGQDLDTAVEILAELPA